MYRRFVCHPTWSLGFMTWRRFVCHPTWSLGFMTWRRYVCHPTWSLGFMTYHAKRFVLLLHTSYGTLCMLRFSLSVRPSVHQCTIMDYEQTAGPRFINFSHVGMLIRYLRLLIVITILNVLQFQGQWLESNEIVKIVKSAWNTLRYLSDTT